MGFHSFILFLFLRCHPHFLVNVMLGIKGMVPFVSVLNGFFYCISAGSSEISADICIISQGAFLCTGLYLKM